ncbi:acetyl xylan esterase [Arthroderma uncinatum]|uniref:acetyl xylan esterase n=1 Tax=Arthroderma uncinatum TaxID=74035 RepID=UPI00144A74BE|nr:acetyl xylan esterase [Arthroderma uncinatum]KAF3480767.1 acetyl xylan esterase [Arthroderma uncinatum]
MANEPFPGKRLQFLACTGDVTQDVIDQQLPEWQRPQQLVTLSIGGNDAFFARILKACLFRILPLGESCDTALKASEKIIDTELTSRIFKVYEKIHEKSSPFDVYQESPPIIMHTLYDNFFNADTDWCDSQTMGVHLDRPKLTKELRAKLNALTERVNTQIDHALTQWNWRATEYFRKDMQQPSFPSRPGLNSLVLIEPNDRFDGHRFCEEGVETFDDPSIWFFKLFGNDVPAENTLTEISTENFDDKVVNATSVADYFGHVDTKTCGEDPSVQNNIAIKDENIEWLLHGKRPFRFDFAVLPLGDSITWGYGSTDGNGYRGHLKKFLKEYNGESDFLGSQRSGNMEDNDNEGHPGFTISQIAEAARKNHLQKRANGGKVPNVILLHAGTNDMNKGLDVDTAHLRLGALIDQLFGDYPRAVIIVAAIIPSKDPANMARILEFNIRVAQEVQSRRDDGKKIWFARLGVMEKGLADSLHPDDYGYKAMAYGWLKAIRQVDNNNWIEKPTGGSGGGGGGGNSECDKLPIWVERGEVANGAGFGQSYGEGPICRDDPYEDGLCECTFKDTETRIKLGENDYCSDYSTLTVNAVQFADLNGDGRDEYLWVHEDGSVTAFQNLGYKDGAVNWWPRGKIASGVGGARHEVRFADLNGDGRAEYIQVHLDGSVSAWLNGLDGTDDIQKITWIEQGKIAGGIGRTGAGVRFADLNGDGRAEYIYLNAFGAARCYLNGGHKYIDSTHGEVGWIDQGEIATGVSGGSDRAIRLADINGDGKADYIQVDHLASGAALLWQNLGGPDNGPNAAKVKWWERGQIASGPGPQYDVRGGENVVFADLNGDGRSEYVLINSKTSAITVWENGCF